MDSAVASCRFERNAEIKIHLLHVTAISLRCADVCCPPRPSVSQSSGGCSRRLLPIWSRSSPKSSSPPTTSRCVVLPHCVHPTHWPLNTYRNHMEYLTTPLPLVCGRSVSRVWERFERL
jgi:hypothetical protein